LQVRKVSPNIATEIYFWGCNPSFVSTTDGVFMIDTPQQPIDAVRWKERLTESYPGPIRYLVNTEPHIDHISGNAYFPGVEVIGHVGLQARYEQAIPQMTAPERIETIKQADPDSVWLMNHPAYPPNPPTQIFTDSLTIQSGEHEIQVIHTPGHTAPQTSVLVPREGVVLTGDNVFHQCKTFIQEADPWQWLAALKQIEAFDVEVIVPGHGEPCGKAYLRTQAQVIENWLGTVEDFVRRGLSVDEALQQPLKMADIDPYPIGQRLFARADWVNEANIRNLYAQIAARAVAA
jgi:cyclase